MLVIKTLAIKFSYIGTKYHGLALSNTHPSIASKLIEALTHFHIYHSNPIFAGRTDAKVNAKEMVASMNIIILSANINYANMLNSKLPNDIVIISYALVENFNARFDCVERYYKYYFVDYNIKMEYVINRLRNTTNFKALCKKNKKKKKKEDNVGNENLEYIRNINKIEIKKEDGMYCLNVSAKSFLHNMIRKMFWLINEYGKGVIDEEAVSDICNGIGYSGTGKADNLVFCHAKYNKDIEWINDENCGIQKKRNISKKIEYAIDKYIHEY